MNIFVSRPTWIAPDFKDGLNNFIKTLNGMELTPRTLGASDYPSKSPLDEVINIMNECQGAIILGYPQIEVSNCRIKDIENNELILPTEWNHIEAALAYSKGLPLIIFHHTGVSRGVFDRGVMNAFIHEIDLTNNSWFFEDAINGAILKWKENCKSGISNFPLVEKDDPSKRKCPNCSTPTKPIYMTKAPDMFNDMASWICTKCNYMEQ